MAELTPKQLKIIDASIELISEKSIQGFTIKNLSQKIGVTDGAIYRHFKSKTEILQNILNNFQNEAKETLDDVCASDLPVSQQIESIFLHHFKYFVEKPAVTAVIFSENIFQNDSHLAKEVFKLLKMHEDALYCIIDSAQRKKEITLKVDKKELVRIIIGSIRYTVTRWRLSNFEFDLIAEGQLLLNGFNDLIKE